MPCHRSRFAVVAVGCLALVSASVRVAAQSSDNNDRLKKALKAYPDADADGDGVLTASEARQYLRKNAGKIELPEARRPAGPEPTLENVKYGPHERNVLDFWKAKSDGPTPVIVFIHGGGFRNGDKGGIRSDGIIQQSLDGGVSFASINYQFRPEAHDSGHLA